MSNELDLRQYMAVLKKRLALILLSVFICSAAAAAFSLLFQDPVYEASTKIIVNQTAAQTTTSQLDINQINSNIMMINTYKEIIKTPAILDKVAEQYPQLGLTANELSRKIQVNSVNNTQVMTLVVQDVDYKHAAHVVNAVSKVFQEEIQHIFKVENVSILNEAVLTEQPNPVSPNVVLNIAIAFIVSLMLTVGISFLLEYLDDTIKSEADVMQYLGQPTLAMISRMSPEDANSSQLSKSKQTYKAGELERVSIEK
ncbi:Wzz/FepE/Etk N-terminal domain-containing protein [Paenibacillus alkaliterrae]|uniref:YveK family protein n=1 Tax=Paenibacillus alkaliterrae TaxID=320909 RepID=UPI001F1FE386|nr:Wzz/FepE/Etk N-terminal domain-containing protein [Paenibacillus alkaliterrae]MCF2939756.1 Wzz/FepE/Etk N-terminal domain-containing protein [Paenibacillus alkaliterrae]